VNRSAGTIEEVPARRGGDGLEEPLDEAMELMHFAFRRVIEAPDRVLAERGFSRLHHRILYVVGHNPGIGIGDVVTLLGVTKQAAHGPVRELCDADLLTMERPGDDRRKKALRLSTEGRRLERRLAHMQHRIFRRAFADAGSGAEDGWREVMDRIGGGRRLRT
jgi:DNA-binding MarR family transcriptional regulator